MRITVDKNEKLWKGQVNVRRKFPYLLRHRQPEGACPAPAGIEKGEQRVRVGCRDKTLAEGRAYWAGIDDRREVLAALDYAEAISDAQTIEVEGVKIVYASLDALIKSKSTYREQDRIDCQQLVRLKQEKQSR